MRVRRLTLERYGAFTDRTVVFGDGLTLVVGANEAGKSTALDALSDLLWGIPLKSGQTFRHGRPALSLGADLSLPGQGDVTLTRRSTGLVDTTAGTPYEPVWQARPQDSRERWRASFGLSHTDLREGGKALCRGEGDLAELVFTARSGRAVRALLDQVNAEADALYKEHRGNKGVAVRRIFRQYDEAHRAEDDAMAAVSSVRSARAALEQAEREVARADGVVAAPRTWSPSVRLGCAPPTLLMRWPRSSRHARACSPRGRCSPPTCTSSGLAPAATLPAAANSWPG